MNTASLRQVRTSQTAASSHTSARSAQTNQALFGSPVSVCDSTLAAYQ